MQVADVKKPDGLCVFQDTLRCKRGCNESQPFISFARTRLISCAHVNKSLSPMLNPNVADYDRDLPTSCLPLRTAKKLRGKWRGRSKDGCPTTYTALTRYDHEAYVSLGCVLLLRIYALRIFLSATISSIMAFR